MKLFVGFLKLFLALVSTQANFALEQCHSHSTNKQLHLCTSSSTLQLRCATVISRPLCHLTLALTWAQYDCLRRSSGSCLRAKNFTATPINELRHLRDASSRWEILICVIVALAQALGSIRARMAEISMVNARLNWEWYNYGVK